MQRTVEKWKRKDYYDTMEITVSNFKLEGSGKGVWERLGGEEKLFFLLLMFGKREKLSQRLNQNAETDSLVCELHILWR